ncbi:MAG: hypothetical protein C0392_08420 [Syntrophus sp. (in: bacteria)]|nr:hypothetical protein [Syntrophus sp. (in: bacteria)]
MEITDKAEQNLKNLNIYMWILMLLWSVVVVGFLWRNTAEHKKTIINIARTNAGVAIERDILYRRWNASKGGLYAPVSKHAPPNPYLNVPDRDVVTMSGMKLTLLNPAYMTRQINEMAAPQSAPSGHLTSLRPLRPENTPDPWETDSLKAFEQGSKEAGFLGRIGGNDYFRLIRPFVAEESCLKCHAQQRVKAGDILGGISISIPMAPLYALEKSSNIKLTITHGLLWLFGLIGIVIGTKRLSTQLQQIGKTEQALTESENKFKTLVEESVAGVYIIQDGVFKYVNRRFAEIHGYSADELIDTLPHTETIYPEDIPIVMENARKHLEDGADSVHYAFRTVRKDAQVIHVEVYGSRMMYQGRAAMIGTLLDITERRKLEELQHALSITDELTGLHNRRGFFALAQQQMKVSERNSGELLLFFVDLDDLKHINDTFGHLEGDKALIDVSNILRDTFRESDIIGRIGGDEFAVLAIETSDLTEETLTTRLRDAINTINSFIVPDYTLSVSVGTAHYSPDDHASLDELLSRADKLMYIEKKGKHIVH